LISNILKSDFLILSIAMASDVLQQREEARKFINKLRFTNGGITDEDRKFLIEHDKLDILESIDTARRRLGAATQTWVLVL
jgi:hypothetical protein